MRDRTYVVFIFLLSFLPVISIFTTNLLPHTHDGLVHLPRMAAFFKALSDFQFPVRWAGDLNYGYGMPLFDFIYQFPYLVSSFLIAVGFGLIDSFKITLAISYVLSGLFMYLFAKEFTKDAKSAFLIAIFYQFFPFRLVEVLVRGSFGEVYTYTFLPLVLYGVTKLLNGGGKYFFILTSVATALLILSHNSVSLLFFGLILFFILFFGNNKNVKIKSLLAIGVGLLLSMFYWFPAIFDHQYTYGNLHMRNLYKEHFAPFMQFFLPNFTNNPSLQTGGIAVSLGFVQVIGIITGIFVFRKTKIQKIKKIILFAFTLLGVSFFFMQPVSSVIWEHVSFLRQFQFPWRFLSVCSFATSILAISFLHFTKRESVYWAIILITIASSIFYWKPSLGYKSVDEVYYWNFPLNTTYYGETDVIWSEGPAKKYAKFSVEYVWGRGTYKDFYKKSNKHTFTVDAAVDSMVVDNTVYFPGWTVFVDKKQVPIEFQDQNWRGLITFHVPKGEHFVKVAFTETKPRFVADIVSLSALFGIIIFAIKSKKT